ncbi:MAG: hypothetical protein HUU55_07620 [Myxococcales bacterium]|nr:hypothetical protein [Myxococcales bacterium]
MKTVTLKEAVLCGGKVCAAGTEHTFSDECANDLVKRGLATAKPTKPGDATGDNSKPKP